MGRAIVREPKVFLMDEPLSNLDAKLRVSTRTQIAALQRRLGITTVYVTHDQVEAMTMGDRVAVLKDGVLQQVDNPLNLYDKPTNVFVAGFIGSPAMNLLEGKVVGETTVVDGLTIPLSPTVRARLGNDSTVTIGVRPEDLRVVADGDPRSGRPDRAGRGTGRGRVPLLDIRRQHRPGREADHRPRRHPSRPGHRRYRHAGARPGQGARVRRRVRRPRDRLTLGLLRVRADTSAVH